MKNQSEEREVLSPKVAVHIPVETPNTSQPSTSIPNTNNNNNDNIQNNINKENNNESMKNIEQEKLYKNYNMTDLPRYHNYEISHRGMNHSSHAIDFSDPKTILNYFKDRVDNFDKRATFLYNKYTTIIDQFVIGFQFHPMVKQIFHIKQILLIIYIINIQYFLFKVEQFSFLDFINTITLRLMLISMMILYIHFYFFGDKLFLQKDEEIEKFLIKRNPEMRAANCEICNTIKVLRSAHCPNCNKCVIKHQLHSDWFNICIGANNELIYAVSVFFTIIYLCISNFIFWYYILIHSSLLHNYVFMFCINGVVGGYITYNSIMFFQNIFVKIFPTNLTISEANNVKQLIYLWNTYEGREMFNPFDKGLKKNLEEMIVNLFDINVYENYKENKHLSEIIEEDKSEEKKMDPSDQVGNFKYLLRLVEPFDPVVSSKGFIYKLVDGKDIINWNKLRIYSVFDVINSPYKDKMIDEAKNGLELSEKYMKKKNTNQTKINNNIIGENQEINTSSKNSNEQNKNDEGNEKIEIKNEDKEQKKNDDNIEMNENKQLKDSK
jgi:hypothetical protein